MKKIQLFCDKCGIELSSSDSVLLFNKQELCKSCFPKTKIYDAVCCYNCYSFKDGICKRHRYLIDSHKYCDDFERDHSF
jgi:hypothetical protein